jgi:hypothetical protein
MPKENYEKAVAQFVMVLFHARTNAHCMHLQAKTISIHQALEEFYEGIVGLADSYAEAFQGCYDVILDFPTDFHLQKEPIVYLEKLKAYAEAAEKTLPEKPNLQNTHADILNLIDTTLNKLKHYR